MGNKDEYCVECKGLVAEILLLLRRVNSICSIC